MPKIKINTIKINEPMMLFWSLIPLVILVISTNYIFNSGDKVLGTSVEDNNNEIVDRSEVFKSVKLENQKFKWERRGVITILFAGSYKNQFDIAYPLLKENNLKAVVSAPSGDIGELVSKMTWLNLQLLQHQGWEVISQSKDQVCDADKLKDKVILDKEIIESKNDLSTHGLYVNTYIPPCGIVNTDLINKVKANYKSLVNFGIINNQLPSVNKYNLVAKTASNDVSMAEVDSWISEARKNNEWLIIVIPEISEDKNNFSISEIFLKNIVAQIKKNNVQVATIGEVLKY